MSDEMFEVPGFRLREMTAEIRRLIVCAERAETEARAGAKLYAAATARAERAEAAIQRVWRLADEIENGPGVAHLRLLIAQQLRAALDSTDPPLDAQRPEERSDEEEFASPMIGKATREDVEFISAVTNAPAAREVSFDPAPERSDEGPKNCPRCGSPRWVSVSLDEGWTRRAQCVPCGAYHPGVIGPGWRSELLRSDAGLPADGEERNG